MIINKEKIVRELGSLVQEMCYRYNAERTDWNEETYEILSLDWDDDASVRKILDKYIGWWFFDEEKYDSKGQREQQRKSAVKLLARLSGKINIKRFSEVERNEYRSALEQALADENFDFVDIIDEAEMAYGGEMKPDDLRKAFGRIYKYICNSS